MIEMDELVEAYAEATGINWAHAHVNHRAGLAAVAGVVQRDQGSTCPAVVETRGAMVRCGKPPGEHDAHLGRHDGWDVVW